MKLLSENKKLPQNRIAELRKKKKLSQAQLAKETGLTRQAISLYETNRREPKLEIWMKLARFFSVPVSYLQGITSSPYLIGSNDSFEQFAYDYGLIADGIDLDSFSKEEKERVSKTVLQFKAMISNMLEAKVSSRSDEYSFYLSQVMGLVRFLSLSIFSNNIKNESQREKVLKTYSDKISEFFESIYHSDISDLVFDKEKNN